MIICASRRTDVPAFHSEWFMNRLRAGYVLVRNPVCREVVHRIDLGRGNVDGIIFITKDPGPMIPHLEEIVSMGHKCMFQITLNPYGRDMEPGVRFKADVAESFRAISRIMGKERVTWRYDPVIFNDTHGIDYHRRKFEMLCRELEGFTTQCTFSFVDIYGKLGKHTSSGTIREVTDTEKDAFGMMAGEVAPRYGIRPNHCCPDRDLSRFGIDRRGCIDAETMRMLGIPYEEIQTPLRRGCSCVKNIDIGTYDTCMHDCIYCYANKSTPGRRHSTVYDPRGEMLGDSLSDADRVVELKSRDVSRLSDF